MKLSNDPSLGRAPRRPVQTEFPRGASPVALSVVVLLVYGAWLYLAWMQGSWLAAIVPPAIFATMALTIRELRQWLWGHR